jgi:uncharacterized protein YqgC (DUF456 family)
MQDVLMTVLAILGWIAFGGAVLSGIALNLLGLFGNWIILGAVGIAAALSGFDHFGGYTLPLLLGLAIVGEVLEAGAAGVGTARYGGGKGAIVAALVGTIVGGIIGTPIFPLVGTVIGACVGAFALATLYELLVTNRKIDDAARAGVGAALGKIAGLFAKTLVGFVMLLFAFLNY